MKPTTGTILLVENDPDTQFLIVTSFKFANLPVSFQVVENGQEAVNYLSGQKPYANRECYPQPVIILTDIRMPNMSGFELLGWVKQHPKLKHLPIVVVSISNSPDDMIQAARLGACSYFVKILPLDDLIDIVAKQVLQQCCVSN
ncbi:MAG: response regulator [Iphinoe sp. HA4291-MV1]|nr:response regulator [Iphinoe sp. HA4291-MV1]